MRLRRRRWRAAAAVAAAARGARAHLRRAEAVGVGDVGEPAAVRHARVEHGVLLLAEHAVAVGVKLGEQGLRALEGGGRLLAVLLERRRQLGDRDRAVVVRVDVGEVGGGERGIGLVLERRRRFAALGKVGGGGATAHVFGTTSSIAQSSACNRATERTAKKLCINPDNFEPTRGARPLVREFGLSALRTNFERKNCAAPDGRRQRAPALAGWRSA